MATAAPVISVEEYLSEVYEPDCDYMDGHLEERNLGELDHSWLQMALSAYLYARRNEWNITVLPEQRVQVSNPGDIVFRISASLLGSRPDGAGSHQAPFHLHRGSLPGRSYEPH